MKKLTTILAAVAMVISTSAFAGSGETVSEKVNSAFQSSFSAAKNVTWTKTNEFYFAHFELNNDDVAVAYSEDGELLGTSHLINVSELPQAVSYSLKEQYGDFAVSPSVTAVELMGKTSYFITVENKASTLRLKIAENGAIAIEKKTKRPVLVGKVY